MEIFQWKSIEISNSQAAKYTQSYWYQKSYFIFREIRIIHLIVLEKLISHLIVFQGRLFYRYQRITVPIHLNRKLVDCNRCIFGSIDRWPSSKQLSNHVTRTCWFFFLLIVATLLSMLWRKGWRKKENEDNKDGEEVQ